MTSVPLSTRQAPARFAALDALRFLAAMAVLAFHFTAREHDSWGSSPSSAFPTLSDFTAYGAFGVDLFFVISGFVILMTAWDRRLPQFIGSRVGRLAPAYWAGVLLTSFLLVVLWPGRKPLSFPQVLVNLTMLQEALGISHVDGVYWTLWVELRFYVLIAVFIAIGLTVGRVIAVAALWPPVAIIAAQTEATFLADVLIAEYAALFAGGMMLYLLLHNPRSTIVWLVLIGNVILSAVWSGQRTSATIAATTPTDPDPMIQALLIILCFALVALTVFGPLSRLTWRWLTLAGALTYPLYVTHEYWGWWFIHVLYPVLPRNLVLVLATLGCLVLAWLIYRFVERPWGPRLRRAVERSINALK